MAIIDTLKKILSNYGGQTPSTGKEVENAFNENFEKVKSSVNSAYDEIAQIGRNTQDWNADSGLTYPATRVNGGKIYRVRSGKTTAATDVPSSESDVWEVVGGSSSSLNGGVAINGGVAFIPEYTLLQSVITAYTSALGNTIPTSGTMWFNLSAVAPVNSRIISIENKVNAIGAVKVFVYNPSSKLIRTVATLQATTTGMQQFNVDFEVVAGEYITCSNTYYKITSASALKLTISGSSIVESTDSVELCYKIGYAKAVEINGLLNTERDLGEISKDVSRIDTSVDNMYHGGTSELPFFTSLSRDTAQYTGGLANTIPSASGNMWFNTSAQAEHTGRVRTIRFKPSSVGAVNFYIFNPESLSVRLIGSTTMQTVDIQSYTFSEPVAISKGEYVTYSNMRYATTTGYRLSVKLQFTAGAVVSYSVDIVELHYEVEFLYNTMIKGLVEVTEILSNKQTIEGKYISLYNDTFAQIKADEWTNNGNSWSINENGIKPTALGSASYIVHKRIYHSDKRFMRLRIKMGADTFLKIPIFWGSTVTTGEGASCFGINFAAKKLYMYAAQSVTTVIAEKDIPVNAVGERDYVIEVHKDGIKHIIKLFDTLTGQHIILEYENTNWSAGRQNQYYGFFVESGTFPVISRYEVFSLNKPDVVFVGDSITEGVGVSDRMRRYSEQFRTNNPDKLVVISARGGDNINGVLAKFNTEYNIYRPKKLVVLIGANGGNTLANLTQLKQACEAIECTLILNYCTCQQSGDTHIAKNDVIAQVGVNGARFDIATALDNIPIVDGEHASPRYNSTLYSDAGLHPNNAGNDEMYRRLLIDTPELFYD